MPYCSGCGSRYQEGDKVCKSCGFELVYNADPKSAGKHPAGTGKDKNFTGGAGKTARTRRKKKTDSIEKPELSNQDRRDKQAGAQQNQTTAVRPAPPSESRCLQSEVIPRLAPYNDIHLGKGIIKPKWIEVGLDGFHFKYEEPPVGVRKTESVVKEMSTEFRSSNQESDPSPVLAPPEPDETGGRVETGPERKGVLGDSAPALCKESGESLNGIVELKTDDAQLAPPVESRGEEPSFRPEEPVSVEIDLPESSEAVIGAAESPAIAPVEENPSPVEMDGESGLESSESSAYKTDHSPDLRDGPADILTVMHEEETEPALQLPCADIAEENLLAEVESESKSGAGVEPGDPTALKTDLAATPEENNTVLWRGQQSWFGIPFPCFYQLTKSSLMIMDSNGRTTKFKVSAIHRVTLRQSWFAKVLGIGDLILEFHDPALLRQVLTGIANPNKAKSILEGLMGSGV
jgi:hypothetical protein